MNLMIKTVLFYIFVCSLGLAHVIVHSPVNSLSSVALNFTFWSACDRLRPHIQIVTMYFYEKHSFSHNIAIFEKTFFTDLGYEFFCNDQEN